MTPAEARRARERNARGQAGIDQVTDEQLHAATAVILARVDKGQLTHEDAYETLSMLGLLEGP